MPDDSQDSKRLGDFELLREIGRGGMGIVYEARQVSLNRRVALKVLPPGLGLTEHAIQRFQREAQAAAKLHHTNIVPVHAIGEADGCHYYAMELIEGQALSDVLKDLSGSGSNPLMDTTLTMMTGVEEHTRATPATDQSSPSLSDSTTGNRKWFDVVAKLITDVADALEYAHDRGVIHRDIKPANLMLSGNGRLCITDFGLARVAQEPGMTVSGLLMGTPAYMSPEQIASGRMKLDHRTDVYSLGAVLYEMLTHRRPFPGESREEILGGILTKEPRPPRRFNPRIPVDLETICQKAMEKDQDKRYATAGEFAEDLKQYLAHGLIKARRAGIIKRAWKAIRRHPIAATAVFAVLVVITASVVAWQAGGRAEIAQRLVADARLALRQGTYRDGLQLIDRALALDPDAIDARIVRARLLIVNYHMYEAAEEAQSVLQEDPQNYAAHTILASLALYPSKMEQFGDGSGEIYEEYRLNSIDSAPHLAVVEASAPESAEANYLRALNTSDTRQRIELLDRALDLNPGDQLASMARIMALGELKDHELILSEADRLITSRPKSAQGWRLKADAYRQQQDFENATAAIERAMDVDDRDYRNYLQRSWILRDKGEMDEALSDLSRAIELDPEQAFLYFCRALNLLPMGRSEEAVVDALKAKELDPDNPNGFGILLISYSVLGKEDEIRATLAELRVRADGWVGAQARAVASTAIWIAHSSLDETDLALAAINRAVEIDPETPVHFINRMRMRQQLDDVEGAKADCEAAARIDLDTAADLLLRGNLILNNCDDLDGALADFNRVIALAPNWYSGINARAATLKSLGHLDRALVDFNRAIELGPYSWVTHTNRGWLYWEMGRFEKALADFRKAMELNPYHAGLPYYYGYVLMRQGRLEQAQAAIEKALEMAPNYADALANRGNILASLGKCDEAAVDVLKAIELSPPGNPDPHYDIAEVHLSNFYYNCSEHYDLDEAFTHARQAYEGDQRNRDIQALALLRKGDYAEAKRLYLEQFEETPEGIAWFPLAMCLWHLDEKVEARRFYARSVAWMDERLPDSPMHIDMRQEAAELLGIEIQ